MPNQHTSNGLWVRYGGEEITDAQVKFAAEHYSVAILQPREVDAARRLKELNPTITVLCYKCLSSTREYEKQAPFTSGVSFAEAQDQERAGQSWFARRKDGQLIEWDGYPGHFQMNVWNPSYRKQWVANVSAELADSPFDGVMGDNDFFGDYYGLNLPIRGARQLRTFHRGLDRLIRDAGKALNRQGKILVPNIAEARCDPGKWERHSAFGGGFEEVFMGWGAEEFLDVASTMAQAHQMMKTHAPVKLVQADGIRLKQPRLTLLRASTDGTDRHPNFCAALAAFWVWGAGERTALAGTAHDAHNSTPWVEELAWDLGKPEGKYQEENGALVRRFSEGWAAVNISDHPSGSIPVPAGLEAAHGKAAPSKVVLPPHQGVIYRRRKH